MSKPNTCHVDHKLAQADDMYGIQQLSDSFELQDNKCFLLLIRGFLREIEDAQVEPISSVIFKLMAPFFTKFIDPDLITNNNFYKKSPKMPLTQFVIDNTHDKCCSKSKAFIFGQSLKTIFEGRTNRHIKFSFEDVWNDRFRLSHLRLAMGVLKFAMNNNYDVEKFKRQRIYTESIINANTDYKVGFIALGLKKIQNRKFIKPEIKIKHQTTNNVNVIDYLKPFEIQRDMNFETQPIQIHIRKLDTENFYHLGFESFGEQQPIQFLLNANNHDYHVVWSGIQCCCCNFAHRTLSSRITYKFDLKKDAQYFNQQLLQAMSIS